MDSNLPSAPPLPGQSDEPPHKVPQLVRATKPVMAENEPPADEPFEADALNEHVIEPGDPDGVVAADERRAAAQREAQTHISDGEQPKLAKKRRGLWLLLIVMLIAVAVAGSYWFANRQTAAPQTARTPKISQATQSAQAKTVATKHYDSTDYALGVDYPEDWTLSDTPAALRLLSTPLQLTTADGSKQSGRIVLTVQHPQPTVAGYPTTGAVAVVASDKLAYTKPTQAQRAQTYLSYLSFGSPNGLDRLYLTGDNGYQQSQRVPLADVTKSNPLVAVAWAACTTNDCVLSDAPNYLTLQPAAWQSSAAAKQVQTLLLSLQFN